MQNLHEMSLNRPAYTDLMNPHGTITREELGALISQGDIDTVIVAFPDLQGRMVGKRFTGWFFLEEVADHGAENCNYLIATDMDDNPVPGYRFASYELGYGDMVAMPDWNTVRVLPWQTKTALVLTDLSHPNSHQPINPCLATPGVARSSGRSRKGGVHPNDRQRNRVLSISRVVSTGPRKRFHVAHPTFPLDAGLPNCANNI